MNRVAVFVDAGYVFAQGSALLAGRKLPRAEIVLKHERAITAFADFACAVSGAPLLRVYWYDGTSTGPTAQHTTLAHLPNTKLRLGFVNSVGQQKGVDSLIVTDIITLARHRAVSDAVLVSGDEDLRVGVQHAQEFGVRVHLLGIQPSRGSQSLFLLQEADTTHEWGRETINRFLQCKPQELSIEAPLVNVPEAQAPSATAETRNLLDTVAEGVSSAVKASELLSLVETFKKRHRLPRDIDRQLLAGGRLSLGRDLSPPERQRVRAHFIEACRTRIRDDVG